MGRVRQESKKEQIHEKIWETLEEKKEGVHYSDLVRVLSEKLPGINKNTIHCAL
ncbi:MAG: hypothetical protein RMK75_04305 [Aquificaceae bacterium]|nr:hypothetical protein [Aquificaceae bacterium]MDW8423531.1 hypothetical protein [Aquificaceae bacterium]